MIVCSNGYVTHPAFGTLALGRGSNWVPFWRRHYITTYILLRAWAWDALEFA